MSVAPGIHSSPHASQPPFPITRFISSYLGSSLLCNAATFLRPRKHCITSIQSFSPSDATEDFSLSSEEFSFPAGFFTLSYHSILWNSQYSSPPHCVHERLINSLFLPSPSPQQCTSTCTALRTSKSLREIRISSPMERVLTNEHTNEFFDHELSFQTDAPDDKTCQIES